MIHLVHCLHDSSSSSSLGDEGSELDGLSEPTSSQQSAPTKAEQSHLIVWQVTTSHDWKYRKQKKPPTNSCMHLSFSFDINEYSWVFDYFVREQRLFLAHFFVQLILYEFKIGQGLCKLQEYVQGPSVPFCWVAYWKTWCTQEKGQVIMTKCVILIR